MNGVAAVDVAVLGAGPAGTVVARRLAAAGASVAVVTGPEPGPAREGYSRRTRERLLEEGLGAAVATLAGPVPRAGTWG
ncbi:MAG: pilus assembly protein CpaE, partial [Proteobacteria bacterium]|nr:pilus assembly protein CpaE [Pseudomonadota bacterium]